MDGAVLQSLAGAGSLLYNGRFPMSKLDWPRMKAGWLKLSERERLNFVRVSFRLPPEDLDPEVANKQACLLCMQTVEVSA